MSQLLTVMHICPFWCFVASQPNKNDQPAKYWYHVTMNLSIWCIWLFKECAHAVPCLYQFVFIKRSIIKSWRFLCVTTQQCQIDQICQFILVQSDSQPSEGDKSTKHLRDQRLCWNGSIRQLIYEVRLLIYEVANSEWLLCQMMHLWKLLIRYHCIFCKSSS